MQFKNILLSTLVFIIAVQFIHQPSPTPQLKATAQEVIAPPSIVVLEEFGGKEYYFKPPLGNAYLFAYGNCTRGVASWTAVPVSGNAKDWDNNARRAGYKISTVPSVGSVAVDNSGYYGHVGLVIDKTDTQVLTREMNVRGLNSVIERWQPYSYWDSYIIF